MCSARCSARRTVLENISENPAGGRSRSNIRAERQYFREALLNYSERQNAKSAGIVHYKHRQYSPGIISLETVKFFSLCRAAPGYSGVTYR